MCTNQIIDLCESSADEAEPSDVDELSKMVKPTTTSTEASLKPTSNLHFMEGLSSDEDELLTALSKGWQRQRIFKVVTP